MDPAAAAAVDVSMDPAAAAAVDVSIGLNCRYTRPVRAATESRDVPRRAKGRERIE